MSDHDALDELQSKLLARKIIAIEDEVDAHMAGYVRESLLRLVSDGNPPAIVIVSSHGGNVEFGMAIYDMIRAYPGDTTGVVVGYAKSMAAIILQACNRRVSLRHAKMLIHNIVQRSVSLDVLRDQERREKLLRETERDQEIHYEILAGRTGKSVGEIRAQCQKDANMDPSEALVFNLIDEIIDEFAVLEKDDT